ncbi:MAG: ABC transporter ATP-binding protein [Clostridiales bacterium]|nr:ABC transporter ATP-binding protein [Clostridiales bacterium]
MVSKEVIMVDDIGMRFNLMEKKVDNLKEYFIKLLKNEIRYQEFWALKNISFTVNKGERLGILGLNGAGKSTLLKIIAGVLKASEGELNVRGKVVPLLELGAGFDAQYTGMENIYLYGAVLGYPKDFINEKFNDIVEFSELGDFINVPVKNYSSGMKARLGFSIATIMDPDILILDEVLSVGDAKFRKKSEKRILDMFERGVTVLFVSHSIEQIRRICDRAIILDKGVLIADGPVEEICNVYEKEYIGELAAKKPKKKKKKKKIPEIKEEETIKSEKEEIPETGE